MKLNYKYHSIYVKTNNALKLNFENYIIYLWHFNSMYNSILKYFIILYESQVPNPNYYYRFINKK